MPKWKVTITTLHCVYSCRDANLFIRFIFDLDTSKPIRIQYKPGWIQSSLFRQWEKDSSLFWVVNGKNTDYEDEGRQTFKIKVPSAFSLTRVSKIEIGFDHTRFVDGWLIGSVAVQDSRRNIVYFNGPGTYGYWHHGTMTLSAEKFLKIEDSFLPHRFVMGPVLGFRGTTDMGHYQLCCLVVTEGHENELEPLEFIVYSGEGTQSVGSGTTGILTKPLAVCERYKLWRYDWVAPRDTAIDYICKYTLPDHRSFKCYIPSFNTMPRIAFATCTGLESRDDIRKYDHSHVMWTHMRNEHMESPFHLLVMGGDNIYADSIMQEVIEERHMKGHDMNDVIGMRDEARRKYFELYVSRWRQPELACMMARVPTLAMWNAHDIFDGWGTTIPTEEHKEVYKAAKEYFVLFQLKGLRSENARPPRVTTVDVRPLSITWLHPPPIQLREPYHDPGPFTHLVSFGEVMFMVLDHRSERTPDRIMSEESWREITGMLNVVHATKHLFVVVPVPLIFVDQNYLKRKKMARKKKKVPTATLR